MARCVAGPTYPRIRFLGEPDHLRVLIANERRDRLELLAKVVIGLGHDVIAREIYVRKSERRRRGSSPMSQSSGSACPPSTRST